MSALMDSSSFCMVFPALYRRNSCSQLPHSHNNLDFLSFVAFNALNWPCFNSVHVRWCHLWHRPSHVTAHSSSTFRSQMGHVSCPSGLASGMASRRPWRSGAGRCNWDTGGGQHGILSHLYLDLELDGQNQSQYTYRNISSRIWVNQSQNPQVSL
jgi:hypothetical protein